jgi:hypothetical protein
MGHARSRRLAASLAAAAAAALARRAAAQTGIIYDSTLPSLIRICVQPYAPFVLQRVRAQSARPRRGVPNERKKRRFLTRRRRGAPVLRARAELVWRQPVGHRAPSRLRGGVRHVGCAAPRARRLQKLHTRERPARLVSGTAAVLLPHAPRRGAARRRPAGVVFTGNNVTLLDGFDIGLSQLVCARARARARFQSHAPRV